MSRLIFNFQDLYGNNPRGTLDIRLKHTILNNSASAEIEATNTLVVNDLEQGTYHIQIFPSHYQDHSYFLMINEGVTKVENKSLLFKIKKIKNVVFPSYQALPNELQQVLTHNKTNVEGLEGQKGQTLYNNLDMVQKAGLLNLHTKMTHTKLLNNRNVFSYVESLRRVRGDRVFFNVNKDLRDSVKNSVQMGFFDNVLGALHTPPQGFDLLESFKTPDEKGNLQLTFFGNSQQEFIVDADIDESSGLGHIIEVIRNIGDRDTNPFDIHQILFKEQGLNTGYKIEV